jgi:hypothetical protein
MENQPSQYTIWDQWADESPSMRQEYEQSFNALAEMLVTCRIPIDLIRVIQSYITDQDRFEWSLSSTKGTTLLITLEHPFVLRVCSLFHFPAETLQLCDKTLVPVPYLVLQRKPDGLWTTPTSATYRECESCKILTKKICSRCHSKSFCSTSCLKQQREQEGVQASGRCSLNDLCVTRHLAPVQFRMPIGTSLYDLSKLLGPISPRIRQSTSSFGPHLTSNVHLPPVPRLQIQHTSPRSHQPLFTLQFQSPHLYLYLLSLLNDNALRVDPLTWKLLGKVRLEHVKIGRPPPPKMPHLVWVHPKTPSVHRAFANTQKGLILHVDPT